MASGGKDKLDSSGISTTIDNSEESQIVTPLKDTRLSKENSSAGVTPIQGTFVKSTITPPTTDSDFQFTPPNLPAPKPSGASTNSCEDDNLNFIKEQLNFLNNESGELATPIHMSNKQKRLELVKKHQEFAARRKDLRSPAKQFLKSHSRGIKRSPQKPIKLRKPKRVRLSIGFAEKSPEKGLSSGAEADTSEDDSTDEENWQIIDDSSDNEIDKALEENAAKQNLTVVNVKNILHQVITNEDVVAMVKNSLNEIAEESSSILIPATFEPKMTRSKFKEVLEKDGSIHHPWPLSPLKKKEKLQTSFLDLPLPEDDEDDDDDEYNPDKEIEMGSYSDEDSESVASSQVSDLGSPRPSTPATPSSSVNRFSDLDRTPSVQGDDEIKSPMGPPPRPLKPLSSQKTPLGKKFHMAMAESDKKSTQKETETIALRTRSKLSLTDTSLVELESNFVAPDITLDMYDTSCDDREWMTFLTGLQKFPEAEDTNDDENDPEYNYLAEAEEEEIDMENFRCDRAVQVSRKEMNELMDELLEAYPDTDGLEDEEKEILKKKAFENVKQAAKESQRTTAPVLEIGLNDSQKVQLDHQMRKHVQLLTQMYVISSGNVQDYQDVKENSKFLLNEIKKFSEVNSTLTGLSAYKVCNLDEAIELVNEDKEFVQIDPKNIIVNTRARIKKNPVSPTKKGRKSAVEKDPSCLSPEKGIENMLCRNYKQLSEKKKDLIYSVLGDGANFSVPSSLLPKSTLPNLTVQQREIFWRSLIFIYPELIPQGSFIISRDLSKTSRVCFTDAEDSLLSLGLEQFRNLPYFRRLIQKFMLPCKTEDQIKIRIKNLTAKNAPDNPVKTFKTEKKLPDFPVFDEPFDANGIKPIMFHEAARLPTWCKEMKIREIIIMHDEENMEGSYSIQRSSSVNIPVVCCKSLVMDTSKSRSAPTTPLNQQQVTGSLQPSPLVQDSTPQNDQVSPVKQPETVRPVHRSAQKSLLFEHISTAASSTPPSSPKLTQLQDIGKKRCGSPGFIKLGESESDAQLASPLPETLTSSQAFTFTVGSRATTPIVPSPVVSAQQTSEDTTSNRKSNAIMIMHGQTPVTCATPTFVIHKSSGTNMTGHIESTVLSSALPSSICSVVHTEEDNALKPISPTKLIDNLSKEVHKEFTPPKVTPPKRAAEIVASYAPYYLSPELMKEPNLSQDAQEKTPNKKSPCSGRFRPVAPKPIVLSTFTSPVKKVSPFLEKKLRSPRRKQLQSKALSLRPKGFVPNPPHISPVKKAASNIINKVLNKRPKALLPKPYGMVSRPLHVHVRKSGALVVNDEEEASFPEMATSESEGMETDYMSGDCIDTMDLDEAKVANKPSVFSKRQKHNSESNRSVESDDTQSEADNLYDSQNEDDVIDDEDHLADLMAASSTICFASQRQSAKDKENKKKGIKKKDATLAMLAPDLLEVDPHRDDKDIAFAQAYLNRTKEALKGNTAKYEQFLKILYDFGKSEQSPVKLYQDLQALLKGYPELLNDFAGFLLPEQALECGCFKASQEFKRAKTFLRKLEVYLARHPSHYQKVMKIFSRWSLSETRNVKELREALEPMLKMQPHLMDELSMFFEDERPPENYLTDHEEITLDDSDTEPDPDGYEVIELPDEQDINGTKMCQCSCHKNTPDQNYLKRNRHCYSCCLKVIDGELYFRVSNKVLKKVNVIYHKPIKARSREAVKPDCIEARVSPLQPSTPAWLDDDPIAEKENVDISLLPKMVGQKKRKDRTRYTSGSDNRSQEAMIYTQDQSVLETYVEPMDTLTIAVSTGETSIKQSISSIVQSKPIDLHGEEFNGCSDMGNIKQSISATNVKTTFSSVDIGTLREERDISPRQSNSGVKASTSFVDIGVLGEGRNVTPKHSDFNIRSSTSTINIGLLDEEDNFSPRKSEPVEMMSNSSSTFPYGGESTTCPDILAKALKVAMISQGDVSMDVHCENQNSIGFPGVKLISSPKTMASLQTKHSHKESSSGTGKHFVKELFASSSDSSDSITIKPTGTFTVNEDASNIGVIKSLDPSDRPENILCTMAREEDSSLSQFSSSRLCDNNSFSKLPCVVEEEEEGVVNLRSGTITLPTFGSSVRNLSKESSQFLSVEFKTSSDTQNNSENPFSSSPCHQESVCTVIQKEQEVDQSNSRPTEPKSVEELSRSSSRLSEPRAVDSPKSVISIIHPEIESSTIGFNADSNSSASSLQSIEVNRLTPRRVAARNKADNTIVSNKGDKSSPGSEKGDKSTMPEVKTQDEAGIKSVSEDSSLWNRDTDRIILEAVKTRGPGSDTFITISQQLPGKTPQQVSGRFHQLLEILASEGTPSEDDVDGNSTSN